MDKPPTFEEKVKNMTLHEVNGVLHEMEIYTPPWTRGKEYEKKHKILKTQQQILIAKEKSPD